ncbi:hypothetical protein RSOLAG22IIIB_11370 [Rhizoctonia solani]|uniref:FTP domain-containing protein n=1 Tax=Rhizoctonia solani TaxID=456999 RepID=A0A0K6G7P4_9AGAM|nr:hypothetical protein RSOLAG22IIIB_11370 [Rhizoctonia solani]
MTTVLNMNILAVLHTRPLEDWRAGLLYVRRDLRRYYYRNPHYESSWYGGSISVFGSEFPPDGPHGYTVQAQHVLREPVAIGPHSVFDQSAQGPPAVEPEPAMGDVETITETHEGDVEQEDVEQDEGGVPYGVPQGAYGYLVQPTGVPDDHGVCIPDFVIGQRNGQDQWRYVSLIEMKASHTFTKADLFRFSRYAERLRSIHRAGLDVGNVIMMFIAGGRVYTWGIDEWPADQLTMRQFIKVLLDYWTKTRSMALLNKLAAIGFLISQGAIAAPWDAHGPRTTHSLRSVGPKQSLFHSYHPEPRFETYAAGVAHPLAKRGIPSTHEEAARAFLAEKFGCGADALSRKSDYSSDMVAHEYFRQSINGIPIANAVANVALKSNRVTSYSASFVDPGSKSVAAATPRLTEDDAIVYAEATLGGTYNNCPVLLEYFAKDSRHVVLSYVVEVRNYETHEWHEASVDAHSGEVVNIISFGADASYRVIPFAYKPTGRERGLNSKIAPVHNEAGMPK